MSGTTRVCLASGAAVALLFASAALLPAQSTERLRTSERPVRVELLAGMEMGPVDAMLRDERSSGQAAAALLAAVRWQKDSPVGVRAIGWLARRPTGDEWVDDPSGTRQVRGHVATVIGLGLAGDVAIPLGVRATVAPSVGAGLVPLARGSGTAVAPETGATGPYAAHQTGTFWSAGLALRVGHLIVEQQILGLLGAPTAAPRGREYFPILVGWRF